MRSAVWVRLEKAYLSKVNQSTDYRILPHMNQPLLGLSLMREADFLKASFPLFENQEVDVLEWSFDTVLDETAKPDWLNPLLKEFSNANRLIGHGVHYSTLDAAWNQKQEDWLAQLKKAFQLHQYQHLTEHFGFMGSPNAHSGCPLPVQYDARSLRVGVDRLKRLQDAAEVPVGLENLALSFSIKDVQEQGVFLEKLVEPIQGFLILDIHNLYCQSHNFNVPLDELINAYPTHLVKEIHLSGGSWQDSIYGDKKIRRDTHDDHVPEEVFEGLCLALDKCPYVEYVILERLGSTFTSDLSLQQFQSDYRRIQSIIKQSANEFETKKWGNNVKADALPFVDKSLEKEQRNMHKLFLHAQKLVDVKNALSKKYPIDEWNEEMVNTAVLLTKKWEQ